LAAELKWPFGRVGQVRTVPAVELVPELLPRAWDGLMGAGVAEPEADRLLGVIACRARAGQTGAVWQRAMLAAADARLPRDPALVAMFERYLECAATEEPVHTWPVE
jgi:hypothetical protein